jgi:two-component system, chemotaxis family, sensor kinase CheA
MSRAGAKRGLGVRAKLIGLAVGTSMLVLLLACGSFVVYDRSSFADAKQSTLSVLVRSVAQSAFGPTAFRDADSAGVILNVLEAEPSARAGAIYADDGTLLRAWGRAGAERALPSRWSEKFARHGYAGGLLQLTRPIASAEQRAGTLHVVFSTDDLDARTRHFLLLAGLVLVVSTLVALLLALIAQRVLTRPVHILSEAAHRVEVERNLDVRAERVSNDEFGLLTDAFNGMLDMIKERDGALSAHRAQLEETVAERTRDLDARNGELRLVLDNVNQGMVILSREGTLGAERSAILDRWFGTPRVGETLWALLERTDAKVGSALALSWAQLIEDVLPFELNLAQLPQQFATRDGRHYELSYQPIVAANEQLEKMLVLISDVTARVERERNEAVQAETISLFEQITADRSGFQDFLDEARATMTSLLSAAECDVTVVLRQLHTLKGNFGLFGLRSMTTLLHTIEDDCIPERKLPVEAQLAQLGACWQAIERRAVSFLGEGGRALTVERKELDALLASIRERASYETLARSATRLALTPVSPKLWRIGESARRLAVRLGKGDVELSIDADGVRGSPELGWLWNVLPHVLSNAVDHGLETPAERAAAGKAGPATLQLTAREQRDTLVIEISDNGRGIAWDKLLGRARALGLPANDNNDALQALFADGVSSRSEASEVSGRGIGLAAVKAACDSHGAKVKISSEPGLGTVFRFELREPAAVGRTPSLARLSQHSVA